MTNTFLQSPYKHCEGVTSKMEVAREDLLSFSD